MTTAAAASIPARAAGPLSRWLSVRHPLHTEAAVVLVLYGLYEVARGLVVGNGAEAERHARHLAATERSLHLLVEAKLQSAVHFLPGLTSLLAAAYVTLHVAVKAAVLLWLHQRRPAAFPFVRTTLLLASGLALIGFLACTPARPRARACSGSSVDAGPRPTGAAAPARSLPDREATGRRPACSNRAAGDAQRDVGGSGKRGASVVTTLSPARSSLQPLSRPRAAAPFALLRNRNRAATRRGGR